MVGDKSSASGSGGRLAGAGQRRVIGAVASVALVAVALILALTGGGDGSAATGALDETPRFVSPADLKSLEGSQGHPIYWAGEQPPDRLELKQEVDGSIYLRYLPPGSAAADPRVTFLTVGTYPVVDAQAAVRRAAAQAGVKVENVASGGIVLPNPASEGSVYLAYPDSDLELEVYDPAPGRAMELIRSGAIRPVGES